MILEVEELTAGYGSHVVLRDIDLSVDTGQVVALLGTNGAGKSTLLRTLAGLQAPKAGTIRLEGRDIAKVPAHKRVHQGLALAPEGQQSFPNMSVRENLLLASKVIRPSASAAEIDEAMGRIVDIFPKLKQRYGQAAGTLSGGERQMLSIGRAMLAEPKILMLDEPSHGLAPIIVDHLAETIAMIGRTTAILIVEQNLSIPRVCATDVVVLENSRIVARGDASLLDSDDVIHAYLGV